MVVAVLGVVNLDLLVIHFSHENFVVGSVVTFQWEPVSLTADDLSGGDALVVGGSVRAVVDDTPGVVVCLRACDSSSTELST